MKERGGRARRETTRSELDEIRPACWVFTDELLQLLWVVEGCVRLWPELDLFLTQAVSSEQILASELPLPTEAEQDQPDSISTNGQPTLL
jgi:hypothetical protein